MLSVAPGRRIWLCTQPTDIRTTNPIESTFATVRHRTRRTRNCVIRATFLGLAFNKLIKEAEKT